MLSLLKLAIAIRQYESYILAVPSKHYTIRFEVIRMKAEMRRRLVELAK